MIDELMDSLLVEHLPTLPMLEQTLADLCRGAEDLDPILHSFKNAQHLRVGVRDVLGRDDICSTHTALADVAEACLKQIAVSEYDKLVEKFGEPTIMIPSESEPPSDGAEQLWQRFADREGDVCEPVVMALGKLGGCEPNYHSDLDLIFLYEASGNTLGRRRGARESTTNGHFFSELGQRVIRMASHLGSHGRLYEVDARLRPTGKSGLLAVPIDAFARYFTEGRGQLWERQSLCKARVVLGSPQATEYAMEVVAMAAFGPAWKPRYATEIRDMRRRLEETASKRNLKRGTGGTVDTEFLVQMLQLKYGGDDPEIRRPGTLDALDALRARGYLSAEDAQHFIRSYRFQRSVEARIRLMNSTGRHELPENPKEFTKLAYLLNYPDSRELAAEAEHMFAENRVRFDRLFDAAERD
jgi:glutamate-ammonia-ligase adenylyltransferase